VAVLTATGITFSDGTSASSRTSFFAPSGTRCLFSQTSAPTGWTTLTDHNNKMLRIVTVGSGAGGGSGGNVSFTDCFTTNRTVSANVPFSLTFSVGGRNLDTNTIPQHTHPFNGGGNTGSGSASPNQGSAGLRSPGSSTGNRGNGEAHAHPIGYSSANGPWSAGINMGLQYVDILLCNWNG